MSEVKAALDEGLKACEELFDRDYFGNHNVKVEELSSIWERFDKANVAYEAQTEEVRSLEQQLDVAREFCRQYQLENKQLKAENLQLKNVIGAMDDIITTPDNQIKVMLYDTLLERDELKKLNNCLVRDKDHLQFLLDNVMLEYCPDEMTEEQMENWKKAQKKSNLETGL